MDKSTDRCSEETLTAKSSCFLGHAAGGGLSQTPVATNTSACSSREIRGPHVTMTVELRKNVNQRLGSENAFSPSHEPRGAEGLETGLWAWAAGSSVGLAARVTRTGTGRADTLGEKRRSRQPGGVWRGSSRGEGEGRRSAVTVPLCDGRGHPGEVEKRRGLL